MLFPGEGWTSKLKRAGGLFLTCLSTGFHVDGLWIKTVHAGLRTVRGSEPGGQLGTLVEEHRVRSSSLDGDS